MKEIKAYVHRNRIADVIDAVEGSGLIARTSVPGVRNINVTSVHSLLKPVDTIEQQYSVELGEAVVSEVRLELVCEDDQVTPLVDLIEKTARTGQAVAGWIVVTDIIEARVVSGSRAR